MSQNKESNEGESAAHEGAEAEEEIDYFPLFETGYCGLAIDMLEDWVATLTRQNKKRIEETPQFDGLPLQNRSVEFLCILCEKMRLAPGVKFTAMALFDTFMIRHVCSLYEEWQKQKDKRKDWATIEAKFSGQITLRLFSCVQIASKLENQCRSVKLDDCNHLLRDMGHSYTREHVLKSELRVLKTLHYRINVQSPLVYMETILKLLQLQFPELPIDVWYPTCLRILEAVFLCRDELYCLLLKGILGEGAVYTRHQVAKLQNDYMFLACSVILSAVFIEEEQEDARWMAWTLHALTGQSFVDMTTFCGAIIERITQLDSDDDEEDEEQAIGEATAMVAPAFMMSDDQPSTSYACV